MHRECCLKVLLSVFRLSRKRVWVTHADVLPTNRHGPTFNRVDYLNDRHSKSNPKQSVCLDRVHSGSDIRSCKHIAHTASTACNTVQRYKRPVECRHCRGEARSSGEEQCHLGLGGPSRVAGKRTIGRALLHRHRQLHLASRCHRELRLLHKAKSSKQNVQHGRGVASVNTPVRVGVHGLSRNRVGQHKRRTCNRVIVHQRILRGQQSIHTRELTVLIDVTERIRSDTRRAPWRKTTLAHLTT